MLCKLYPYTANTLFLPALSGLDAETVEYELARPPTLTRIRLEQLKHILTLLGAPWLQRLRWEPTCAVIRGCEGVNSLPSTALVVLCSGYGACPLVACWVDNAVRLQHLSSLFYGTVGTDLVHIEKRAGCDHVWPMVNVTGVYKRHGAGHEEKGARNTAATHRFVQQHQLSVW